MGVVKMIEIDYNRAANSHLNLLILEYEMLGLCGILLPCMEIAEETVEQCCFSTLHDHAAAVSHDRYHTHPCVKYREMSS